ncbi:ABC transporter ATP-binding protein [Balneatrix alpica]|uniref:ABC transporter ATP-binding protein n=1 Tax=Balneatrix alpica TaxID=75684 RepID=A0ABV5Z797_9GAMM|nr:ABC transporter ATP-binding protein [Balneatrix alpica]
MASITLKGIKKQWEHFTAVKNLDLEIKDKEFLVLLGPSGCGKTTTMRMIAGLEDPSQGDIFIGDRRVNDLEPKDRDVAMVFQSYALYPQMTVLENIEFPLKIRGLDKEERRRQAEKAANLVELGNLLGRRPRELSGGQRQRVALARAIVRQPEVFLMDEPLSNLDAKLRGTMRAQLKHLHHELATTTVYVTHDQIEAMTLASRIAVINKGEIQQLDTPENIYNDPANLFVATFIGSPPMNIVRGNLKDGVFSGPGTQIAGFATDINAEVYLGIRAEDLEVVAAGQGHINAPVYSLELTGESTMVTVRVGDQFVTARGDRHYREEINSQIGLRLDPSKAYLFDTQTEQRICRHPDTKVQPLNQHAG